jgi:hypothetical protein
MIREWGFTDSHYGDKMVPETQSIRKVHSGVRISCSCERRGPPSAEIEATGRQSLHLGSLTTYAYLGIHSSRKDYTDPSTRSLAGRLLNTRTRLISIFSIDLIHLARSAIQSNPAYSAGSHADPLPLTLFTRIDRSLHSSQFKGFTPRHY